MNNASALARALRGPDKQENTREIAKADPKLVAKVEESLNRK